MTYKPIDQFVPNEASELRFTGLVVQRVTPLFEDEMFVIREVMFSCYQLLEFEGENNQTT